MIRRAALLTQSGKNWLNRFWILDFGFWIGDPRGTMNEGEFKDRTKQFALRVIRLVEALPTRSTAAVIGKQLLRSATSVGANYRAACRGKSSADVINKLCIVEEEADESLYWMELLIETNLVAEAKLGSLMAETNEIIGMTVSSIKTLRSRRFASVNPKSKIQNPKSIH